MSGPYVYSADKLFEPAALWRGEEYRHSLAKENAVQRSIAISLKRMADMMEEDRKPRLELLPEGFETAEGKRHREWKERIDRAYETDARGNAALEAIADLIALHSPDRSGEAIETPKSGSTAGESRISSKLCGGRHDQG